MLIIYRCMFLILAVSWLFLMVTADHSIAAPPDRLHTMTVTSLSAWDKLTLTTLQGLVAQSKPEIWLKRPDTDMWLDDLVSNYGVTTVGLSSVAGFIDQFRDHIDGYVLCNVGQPSQNVAASIAGVRGLIVLTPENENHATSRGIPMRYDVRGLDDNTLYSNLWYMFSKNIGFEQKFDVADLCSFLYDTATYRGGMIWYRGTDQQNALRRTIASSLDPHSPVLGYAANSYERSWIRDLSQSTAGGIAADGWHNGSVLSQVQVDLPIKQKTHMSGSPSTEDNVHYVSFIMCDGDNIQCYQRSFYTDPMYWASPYRGQFNMGWEINPVLTQLAPTIMKQFYDTASNGSKKDYFICSGAGYMNISPELYPDMPGYANPAGYQRLERFLTDADLSIVNAIFYDSPDYARLNSILDLPGVWGMTVKADGINYAAGNGSIYWYNGKPAVNYKYFISSPYHTSTQVANGVNGRPRSPKTNQDSYTLVAVNPWCVDPMVDIVNCISQFHASIRVVTPEVFFYHLRKNFGTPVSGPGVDTSPPSIPTGVTAAAASSKVIQIRWAASTDNVAVKGYRVFRNGALVGKSETTSYTDSGLHANTTYTYRVSAYDTSGNASGQSSAIQISTLQPEPGDQLLWLANNRTGPSGSRISYFTDGVMTFTENNCSGGWEWYWDDPVRQRTVSLRDNSSGTNGRGFMDTSDFGDALDISKGITVAARVRPINISSHGTLCLSINNSSTAGWGAGSAHVWVGWNDEGRLNGRVVFHSRFGDQLKAFESSVNFRGLWTTWTLSAVRIGSDVAWDLWIEGVHQSPTHQAADGTFHTLLYNGSTDMGTRVRIGQRRLQTLVHNTAWRSVGITNRGVVPGWDGLSDVSPPSVPSNVQAAAQSATSALVSWNASTDAVGVAGYRIYRNGVTVATTAATNYLDAALTANATYSYNISAYDAAENESPLSSPPAVVTLPDTEPPSIPTNVAATAQSETSVLVTWTASTDNVGVTGYKVFRNGNLVGTSGTTSYSNTGLSPSTTYSYRVSAYDAAGNESAQSSPPAVVTTLDNTPPSVPTNVAAAAQSETSVQLTWTASTDNVGVTGYKLFRNGVLAGTSGTASFTDTGLSAGVTYSYRVSAHDAAGNNSAQSSPPAMVTMPDNTPPSVPTDVTATAQSYTSILVAWTASTDNVSVMGYKIFRNGSLAGTSGTTSFSDTGLSSGTTYTYTVSAYDAAGNESAQCSPVTGSPHEYDIVPPSVPANVQATAITPKIVRLTWGASTDDVGVEGYRVFRNGILVASTTSTSYQDSVVSQGSTYSYTVSAYDAAGNESAQSPPAPVATPTAMTIAEAKLQGDSAAAGFLSKRVSVVLNGSFYIQEEDRNTGIKVVVLEPIDGLSQGVLVDIGGFIHTDFNGERFVLGYAVSN